MKKVMIVYYSYSGNTEKLAKYLNDTLSPKYKTSLVSLNAVDESSNFFMQCIRAFKKKQAKIDNAPDLDLDAYDMICFGTPVWAFGMAPAMRTFLNECRGLDQKQVLMFTTYGSGVGVDKCIGEMVQIAKLKGADEIRSMSIQQGDLKNKVVLDGMLKKTLGI